jgi:hypothetical protein
MTTTSNLSTSSEPARQSVAEIRATQPRKRNRRRSAALRPMSDKQRAWNMSPSNLDRLRDNLQGRSGVPTRRGVPDGWGGRSRRKRLAEVRAMAEEQASQVVERLCKAGILEGDPKEAVIGPDGIVNDHAAARAAIKFALGVVLAVDPDDDKPAYTVAMRLRAARLVLAYTLPVPVKGSKKDGGWIKQAEALVRLVLA